MRITLAQRVPGVKLTRTNWSIGNRVRWSPQKLNVFAIPLCTSVTKVTEAWPLVALNCTMLTSPLALSIPGVRAPRTKMSPQAEDNTRRTNTNKTPGRRFIDHLRREADRLGPEGTPSLHPATIRRVRVQRALPRDSGFSGSVGRILLASDRDRPPK